MKQDHVWHAAAVLVKQHGARAPRVAARIAHELLVAEEIEERLVWMRVMVAAEALLWRRSATN